VGITFSDPSDKNVVLPFSEERLHWRRMEMIMRVSNLMERGALLLIIS